MAVSMDEQLEELKMKGGRCGGRMVGEEFHLFEQALGNDERGWGGYGIESEY